jgi:hypothetical protein
MRTYGYEGKHERVFLVQKGVSFFGTNNLHATTTKSTMRKICGSTILGRTWKKNVVGEVREMVYSPLDG